MEKGINELEQAKQKVKNLESEKDEILQQLEKTKEFNDKILADYESVLEKYNDADKNLKEFEVVKSELRIKEKENKKISEGKIKINLKFLFKSIILFTNDRIFLI